MLNAFTTALSALRANGLAVDIIGHNLANVNTTGFKASAVHFSDLMSQSLTGLWSASQVGGGTARPTAMREYTQGSIQATGGVLDAAIQGGGFFVVRGQSGQTLFTRAGNFRLDAQGNLVTGTGQFVQGWKAAAGAINTAGPVSGIAIPLGDSRPPSATTRLAVEVNLDAAAAVDETFSTPVEVVDSLGARHLLTITFTKTAVNAWDYAVTIPGQEVSAGTAGEPYEIPGASGALAFNSSGQLTTPAADAGTVTINIPGLASGAADLSLTWELYRSGDVPRLTQYGQPSNTAATEQDGFPPGQLVGIAMGDSGRIVAQYSNGQQQLLGQLALASIRNPESLISVGDNNLQVGADTAEPAIGPAETGGRGRIVGQSLESSTVDIAREFTNLILMQRGYQANARVITAADELSQEVMNLKR